MKDRHFPPTRKKMVVSLTPELERFVAQRVASGLYSSASEVCRAALRLLKKEERHRLLAKELDHRLKNTLATVQSIAAQTLRGSRVARQVRDILEGRLLALANAHDMFTQARWDGVGLRKVIRETLQPFGIEGCRSDSFTVEGGDVRVQPKVALALAMTFHELATNAAKYGALSNGGHIDIIWAQERTPQGVQLQLRWQESGGPPVMPPGRKGFGSRLIETALPHELDGEVYLNFDTKGVVCEIVMPVPHRNAQ